MNAYSYRIYIYIKYLCILQIVKENRNSEQDIEFLCIIFSKDSKLY